MMPPFDPSQLDPKVLMELTQLIRQLPPEKISRMQTLMHNMMAGYDVRKEMEEFEQSLPPGFREKIAAIMLKQAGSSATAGSTATPPWSSPIQGMGGASSAEEAEIVAPTAADMDLRQARMTVLRAVAEGKMSPEEAEKVLFAGV